jgi:hypothetical protein
MSSTVSSAGLARFRSKVLYGLDLLTILMFFVTLALMVYIDEKDS